MKLLSRVRLFAIPWTVAYKAPLSMKSSRQEYWSGLPFPSPGDLPDPGIKPWSPASQADSLPFELQGSPQSERSWFPWRLSGKETVCQCRRYGFYPWVRKIFWRRKWQPTPVFLPGEFHGQGAWQATVHGVSQAGILEWVAISFSRGSSRCRDQTPGLLHCRQTLY